MKRFVAILMIFVFTAILAACNLVLYPAAAGEHGGAGDGSGGAANAGAPASVASLKIVVDPGHGGKDYGAVGTDTGVLESELNLQVANHLVELFEEAGAQVLMTRQSAEVDYSGEAQTEKLKDMNNRAQAIREFEPDAVVSVHMNKFSDRSVRGAEVFWQNGREIGQSLAQYIQDELNNRVNTIKQRRSHSGDLYILQVVDQPSVLVECGYLSNAEEEKLLQDKEHQKLLAQCIFDGVCKYFGVERAVISK